MSQGCWFCKRTVVDAETLAETLRVTQSGYVGLTTELSLTNEKIERLAKRIDDVRTVLVTMEELRISRASRRRVPAPSTTHTTRPATAKRTRPTAQARSTPRRH